MLSALLSRRDGDIYGALRDCHATIRIDKQHVKAHLRYVSWDSWQSWFTYFKVCWWIFFSFVEWCGVSWNWTWSKKVGHTSPLSKGPFLTTPIPGRWFKFKHVQTTFLSGISSWLTVAAHAWLSRARWSGKSAKRRGTLPLRATRAQPGVWKSEFWLRW